MGTNSKRIRIAVLSLCASFVPQAGHTCSMCVTAMADQYLPPLGLWCSIASLWFIGNAAIASNFRRSLKLIPGLWKALAIVIGLAVLGAAITGMEILIALLIPSAIAVGALLLKPAPESPSRFSVSIRILAGVAMLSIVVATVQAIQTHRTRTPTQFILEWGDVTPSLAIVDRWKMRVPEPLSEYRHIIQNAHRMPVVVTRLSERLSEIGDPTIDIPIVAQAFERCDREPWPDDCRDSLKEPLNALKARQASRLEKR